MVTPQILVNAAEAITAKLRGRLRQAGSAVALPAALAALLFWWTVELYAAGVGFRMSQSIAIVLSLTGAGALTSFALARLFRSLRMESPSHYPRQPGPFTAGRTEGRIAAAILTGLGFIALGMLFKAAAIRLIDAAFIAPGSEALERIVAAAAGAIILTAVFYGLGRFGLVVPALAFEARPDLTAAIRRSEGHAATLFLLALAAPLGLAGLLALPAAIMLGLPPWPAPEDIGRMEMMAGALRGHAFWALPLIALATATFWIMTAAGLTAAYESVSGDALPAHGAGDA